MDRMAGGSFWKMESRPASVDGFDVSSMETCCWGKAEVLVLARGPYPLVSRSPATGVPSWATQGARLAGFLGPFLTLCVAIIQGSNLSGRSGPLKGCLAIRGRLVS
nr:hypothetical protein Iba_chr05dCG13540 [Ipomoea batatas]